MNNVVTAHEGLLARLAGAIENVVSCRGIANKGGKVTWCRTSSKDSVALWPQNQLAPYTTGLR